MKKEIKYTNIELPIYSEYTLEELKEVIESYLIPYTKTVDVSRYTVSVETEREPYETDSYGKFYLHVYRLETDREEEIREALEKKQKLDILNKKAIAEKSKKLKQELEARLLEDPEYQKFIELQKKSK